MFHYCCFCGCPLLVNVRDEWLKEVEICGDSKDNRQLSFTPPPTVTSDIVTISAADGEFWSDTVCVGRAWSYKGYVSSPSDIYGNVPVPPNGDFHPHLIIHPWCLSFLCRRINATPEQIWGSVYGPGSDYVEDDSDEPDRLLLLDYLEYYDLSPFHKDDFQYFPLRIESKRDGKAGNDVWRDSYATKELQWIFARPNIFPLVPSLDASILASSASPGSISQASSMKIFNMSEIFDVILDYVIGQDISPAQLKEELLQSDDLFTPPSIEQGTKTLFALLQVNKALYIAIVQDRQSLFLRLTWMHGWMLPITPKDWKNWPNGSFHTGKNLTVKDNNQDWRAYLLIFLRKENVHVRNRWRFHRMAMQFGRGRSEVMNGREYRWRLPVGELDFRPDIEPPTPWVWESREGNAV